MTVGIGSRQQKSVVVMIDASEFRDPGELVWHSHREMWARVEADQCAAVSSDEVVVEYLNGSQRAVVKLKSLVVFADAPVEAIMDLHRDADDNGLLVGPDCPDCRRRFTVVYRCVWCEHCIKVPGEFHWMWQGLGHWHKADDPRWYEALQAHMAESHAEGGAFVPARDD